MITYWKNIILFGTIWDKVTSDFKKECDTFRDKKSLKTKTLSYGNEAIDFHNKEIPKMGFNHTCSALITIDSALKKDKNYYLQVFLKEYKYIEKEKKND